MTNFEAYLKSQDRSPLTSQAYLSDLRQFAAWFEQTNGETPTPKRVTVLDVRDYRQYLLTVRNRKPSTINRHLASIAVWLDWAMTTGQISHNPARQVRGMNSVPQPPKWLTRQEEGALLRQVERAVQSAKTEPAKRQALRNRALVVGMLNTGLRAGEICNLRMGDIEISERKGQVTVRSGKGNKQRSVPLNKQARQALAAWLDVRPDVDSNWVFTGQRGNKLSTSALRRVISDLAHAAKLDPQEVSPHTLRHTCAKRLVDVGVSLEKVATLLGHSNLNTTRIYLIPGQQDLEYAVELLEY